MTRQHGGVVFPLSAESNLHEAADPFSYHALRYFKTCLNHYLGAAYRTALPGQSRASSGDEACAETTHLDPVIWLSRRTWRFPLLAIYPQSGGEAGGPIEHPHLQTRYRLAYVLPPVDTAGAEKLTPILAAARKLITVLLYTQGDPAFDGETGVLGNAGITECAAGNWEVGTLVLEQKSEFPTLFIDLNVTERMVFYGTDLPDLERVVGSVDLEDADTDTTVSDLVVTYSDVG